jgi:two-component system chemotaxis response regulator CheY
MRILIADDESTSLKKMELIMKFYGQCEMVGDGQEAVDAFTKAWADWSPYDLMLLDQMMPSMNGDAAVLKIRALEKEKNVPEDKTVKIIIVTGKSDKDTVVTCVQAGCNGFIIKPIDRQMVEGKIFKLFPLLNQK